MTKHLFRISIIAALAATAIQAETYYSNVPFKFVVGNKTVAAGEYVIDTAAVSGAAVIKSAERKEGFMVVGTTVTSKDSPVTGKLVFHRYGDRYFLAEVWTRGDSGRKLPQTSEEKELTAQGKTYQTQTTIASR